MTATAEFDLRTVPIADVFESPFNTRKHFDATRMRELEASVREVGVLTPLLCRQVGQRFELAAGHRRLRAALAAGVTQVPVSVKALSDSQLLEVITIENLQREDVHPLDEAVGYKGMLQRSSQYTVAILAAKIGKSESYVYRRLKLLELEAGLQTALAEDRLSVAHAEKLLRLPPDIRAEAADPEQGVVWRHSYVFDDPDGDGTWTPQREDLRPLHELEQFIRTKSHFNPASLDTRHLQPELAEQLDATTGAGERDDEEEAAPAASLIELSLDPMARSRLGVDKSARIPLTPSRWREVTEKTRCPHVVRGVITHGGAARVLEVCITRSCQKHFPVAKKKPAGKKAAAPARDSWKEEQAKRDAERKDWEAMRPVAGRAFAAHIAKVKVNAAFVRNFVSPRDLKEIETYYGVVLSDVTANQVIAISNITSWDVSNFGAETKRYGWDFKAFEKKYRVDIDAKGKAALRESRETLKKKGTAKATKKGGK